MMDVIKSSLVLIVATFGVTLALLFLLSILAKKIGLLDHPSDRKRHQSPTPLVGGIAIAVSILLINFYFGFLNSEHEVMMTTMIAVVLVGVVDDYFDLKASRKLIIQIYAASLVVMLGGLKVTYLGNLLGFGSINLPVYMQVLFTVIALVGLMNAMNMIDGIDGLAASISLISIIGFFILSFLINDAYHLQSVMVFGSAVIAFLVLNFRFTDKQRAKVFLGDAGSMLLGFLLTTLAIHLSRDQTIPVTPIAVVWIVALPLMDMARLILTRWKSGSGPMTYGRDHLHHILLKMGYSVRQVVLVMVGLQTAFVVIAIISALYYIPDYLMFYGFIFTLIAYCLGVTWIDRMIEVNGEKQLIG